MAVDSSLIPEKLKQAYLAKSCGILVGAGASAGAGLPLWGKLLENMIDAGQAYGVVSLEKAAQYRILAKKPDKYLMVAAGLKDDVQVYFDEFMETTFIKPCPAPTGLHEALVALDKLQFILTTNYDTIIERAYRAKKPDVSVCNFKDSGEIQRRLWKREFFILKAHGDAAKMGDGVILTEGDYRNLLYRQRGYQSLLSTMFTMFTMLFVGASMTDPEITLLLGYIADAYTPSSGQCHFALMAKEDITTVETDRWLKDFKVQIIPVSKANDYAEMTEFLVALNSVT